MRYRRTLRTDPFPRKKHPIKSFYTEKVFAITPTNGCILEKYSLIRNGS